MASRLKSIRWCVYILRDDPDHDLVAAALGFGESELRGRGEKSKRVASSTVEIQTRRESCGVSVLSHGPLG